MRILTGIIILLLFGYHNDNSIQGGKSYWLSLKDSFAYNNLEEFVCDSVLKANYTGYHKIKHALLDSLYSKYSPCYLYSWQERDTSKIEFTILHDKGERGIQISYLIFDRQDRLLSSTIIAGSSSEGGSAFETFSRFVSKDSLINIGAITQFFDMETMEPLKKTKGDSTFSHLIINKEGRIKEKLFREKHELDPD